MSADDSISISTIIGNFKTKGIKSLNELSEKTLNDIIKTANEMYYSSSSSSSSSSSTLLLTDNEYDVLISYVIKRFPTNTIAKEGHATINVDKHTFEKNKIELPYQMWSMDKIKPNTDALIKWIKKYKGRYIVSCKLDGISALYSNESGIPKLYTRGNGIIGQDISHLIPYLGLSGISKNVAVRGEIIMPKQIFTEKYGKKFANPRNLVSGIVNMKKIEDVSIYKDLSFVAYEVITPILSPSHQLEFLSKMNKIETVMHCIIEKNITNQILSELLVKWRKSYLYEIDGIICMNDKIYPRKEGNPDHAFAFKMVLSDQIAEAIVVDVIWTPSKDGYLKPRVQIEPITLGGVKIEYATGFNAKFIKDNCIGIGAVISIVRSGDVIPHITGIIKPAAQPLFPSDSKTEYEWNATQIDIVLTNKNSDETVIQKNITGFFTGIEVEGLSSGNIKRLIEGGYDSIPKIIRMTLTDYLKIDGFKEKLATKIKNGIETKLNTASLPVLMNASNLFGRGFGVKKLKLILDTYPSLLVKKTNKYQKSEMVAMVKEIPGMAEKTSLNFVEKIDRFVEFMKELDLEDKLYEGNDTKTQNTPVETESTTHELHGKKYVMTGFRDKETIAKLEKIGAIQSAGINKSTYVLIVKTNENKNDNSVKINEAKKLGVPIMAITEFISTYHI